MTLVFLCTTRLVKIFESMKTYSLGETDDLVSSEVKEFIKYVGKGVKILSSLAIKSEYQLSSTLSLLLLPSVISGGSLELTKKNVDSVMKWVVKGSFVQDSVFQGLHTLKVKSFSGYPGDEFNYPLIESFMQKLTRLRIIYLEVCVNDTLMDFVSRFCKDLHFLHCNTEIPYSLEISDSGIAAITLMKKLKSICINPFSSRHELEYGNINWYSISQLLVSLPCLESIQLPDFLQRPAFQFLHHTRVDLPNYRVIQSSNMSCLEGVLAVCPSIRSICLVISVNDISLTIAILEAFDLNNLSELQLFVASPVELENFIWNAIGPKLLVLDLSKSEITWCDLTFLSDNCPNLTSFTLCNDFQTVVQFTEEECLLNERLLFPTLKHLYYNLFEKTGLLLFAHPASNITYLAVDNFFDDEGMTRVIANMKTTDCFPQLETLSCPHKATTVDVKDLAITLPCLKTIKMIFLDIEQTQLILTFSGHAIYLEEFCSTEKD